MTRTVVPVLIETQGKQEFIFGTSKRREAVGASYLVHAIATEWVAEAVQEITGTPVGATIASGGHHEVLVRTSGTFLAFFVDVDHARSVISAVTLRALREAPGLGVTGVVGDPIGWASNDAPAAVAHVFRAMATTRATRPSAAARFPVLPVTALCPSSALPVAGLARVGESTELRSAPSLAKLASHEPALTRLAELSGLSVAHVRRAARRLDGDQPDSPRRVAVVHADGNGLGGVFKDLAELMVDEYGAQPDNATYAAAYRNFSAALATNTERAFRHSVQHLQQEHGADPDVLALVLAGDDITFVADAALAPVLTRLFLTELGKEIANDPATGPLLRRRDHAADPRIGIAAGLVVTTPHFPFSASYSLAEELVSQVAKRAKTEVTDSTGKQIPCVSLAVHVQLDSTATTAEALETGLTVDDHLLTATPYVEIVDIGEPARELSERSRQWLKGRWLDELWQLATAVLDKDSDGRRIRPSAQLHELRARLRPHPGAASEYLERLIGAAPQRWEILREDPRSLFTARGADPPTTRLLDALSLAPLLVPHRESNHA
ncbi:MAG: hypothetical protein ACT4NY_12275 [Pseudonocardiales bacterium]